MKDELRHQQQKRLQCELVSKAAAEGTAAPTKPAKAGPVAVPANVYNRGLVANLWEVLYPPSSRPANGFAQAREARGAMLRFPARSGGGGDRAAHAAATDGARAEELDEEEEEDDDYDSDDGANLPGAVKAHAD